MISDYLKFLDTVKQANYSLMIGSLRQKIITMLQSDKFSTVAKEFLVNMRAGGEPFSDFSHEPAQISQIKKIINALYHAEVALKQMEKINWLDGSFTTLKDITVLSRPFFEHTYQALFLITHIDIDANDLFSKELRVIVPLLTQFQRFAASCGEGMGGLMAQVDSRVLPHAIGVVGGKVVDQLNPQGGAVDYEFLTRFSAVLPSYLDRLSGYIEHFSSKVAEHQPGIDKIELDALQANAMQLLSALEGMGSSLTLPVKALRYIHIIRNTITLSMSIFNQAGKLNESTQDTVRDLLAKLKYNILPELFGLIDKIEEQAMLTPGVLSNPTMVQVSRLYQLLIDYTKTFVDFSVKGQELVTVEDSAFVAARLDQTYLRVGEHHAKIRTIDEVKRAAAKFFAILEKYQAVYVAAEATKWRIQKMVSYPPTIISLDRETKHRLAALYQQIQPYLSQINSPANSKIIDALIGSVHGNSLYIKDFLLLRPDLDSHLTKIAASHQFLLQLTKNITASIPCAVENLKLFPQDGQVNPFAINEAGVLKVELAVADDGQLVDLEPLTKDQSLTMYRFYQTKCAKLADAQEAYVAFHTMLRADNFPLLLDNIQIDVKRKLRNLYGIFQPYLAHSILSPALDKSLVDILGSDIGGLCPGVKTATILGLHDSVMNRCFDPIKTIIERRTQTFSSLAGTLISQASANTALVQSDGEAARAHHVIKHQACSKAISEIRTSLFSLKSLFNDSVRAQLQESAIGIPFPELEDVNNMLAQSSQALGIKRLFNCLYHLEEIMRNMEGLSDKSAESVYVYNVIRIGMHIYAAIDLAQSLAATPSLLVMVGDVQRNLQKAYAAIMELRRHYVPEAVEVDGTIVDLSMGHSAVLSYTLNALMVLPEHIKALRGDHDLSEAEIASLSQHAEKVTTDIERILANSSSYFRLFLEIPTMYGLFGDLKSKLAEMATASHDVVMDNLDYINNHLLTNMLLEADRREDYLGLRPGTLTYTMKELFDAFYQGLLQPLGLKSQRTIALAGSMFPIQQRLQAANERIVAARTEQDPVTHKIESLERLLKRIAAYQNKMQPRVVYGLEIYVDAEVEKRQMMASFKKLLPLIKEVKPYLGADIPTVSDEDQALDVLLNGCVPAEPPLINIYALAVASLSYFKGLSASYQLTLGAAQEKVAYLDALKVKQVDLNTVFTDNYTQASFKRQAATLAAKLNGLAYSGEQYHLDLAAHLQTTEAEIVGLAKSTEDIDKTVSQLLLKKVTQFDEVNYRDYYHLNTMMAAISQLQGYVDQSMLAVAQKNSVFENENTLKKKTELVKTMYSFANDTTIPIADRLSHLKGFIMEPIFKPTILACHHHDDYTWAWLKQCIATFFEWIGLYVPDHKKCHNQLVKSVEEPPADTPNLIAKLGLFSARAPQRAYDSPLAAAEPALVPAP